MVQRQKEKKWCTYFLWYYILYHLQCALCIVCRSLYHYINYIIDKYNIKYGSCKIIKIPNFQKLINISREIFFCYVILSSSCSNRPWPILILYNTVMDIISFHILPIVSFLWVFIEKRRQQHIFRSCL